MGPVRELLPVRRVDPRRRSGPGRTRSADRHRTCGWRAPPCGCPRPTAVRLWVVQAHAPSLVAELSRSGRCAWLRMPTRQLSSDWRRIVVRASQPSRDREQVLLLLAPSTR